MRISAREARVKPHLRTRSDIKIFTHPEIGALHLHTRSKFLFRVFEPS